MGTVYTYLTALGFPGRCGDDWLCGAQVDIKLLSLEIY